MMPRFITPFFNCSIKINFIDFAVTESIISDACDAAWDVDGGQAAARRESSFSDACNAVGDSDGCQTVATVESIVSNPFCIFLDGIG